MNAKFGLYDHCIVQATTLTNFIISTYTVGRSQFPATASILD